MEDGIFLSFVQPRKLNSSSRTKRCKDGGSSSITVCVKLMLVKLFAGSKISGK
ncbi:hypothetical protein A2U01_0090311, partial [Trifolium medium]|nr:hypothetical protein [Trifolium medium]